MMMYFIIFSHHQGKYCIVVILARRATKSITINISTPLYILYMKSYKYFFIFSSKENNTTKQNTESIAVLVLMI
jgi:hypothetical protein